MTYKVHLYLFTEVPHTDFRRKMYFRQIFRRLIRLWEESCQIRCVCWNCRWRALWDLCWRLVR